MDPYALENNFPAYLSHETHVETVLDVWHFATVGLMDKLPRDCAALFKVAVSEILFAAYYHMAVLLDELGMLNFLAANIL